MSLSEVSSTSRGGRLKPVRPDCERSKISCSFGLMWVVTLVIIDAIGSLIHWSIDSLVDGSSSPTNESMIQSSYECVNLLARIQLGDAHQKVICSIGVETRQGNSAVDALSAGQLVQQLRRGSRGAHYEFIEKRPGVGK